MVGARLHDRAITGDRATSHESFPAAILSCGTTGPAGAARRAPGRAMLGLRPRRSSRSHSLAPTVLNQSDRIAIARVPPASRCRASADGGDGRHDGTPTRPQGRTVATATAPGPRRHRRHHRAGRCRQLAAERRALPTPEVSSPVPVLADTTVRTSADAVAAPVGHDDGAARSRASPEAARLILVNPSATAGFGNDQRVSLVYRPNPGALRRIARAMREGQAAPGEPPRRNPERPAAPAPAPPACQTREASR